MANFGVIRMVAKELVRANTLSGKRRRVKLNDVTKISDFNRQNLMLCKCSSQKKTEYKLKSHTKSCD